MRRVVGKREKQPDGVAEGHGGAQLAAESEATPAPPLGNSRNRLRFLDSGYLLIIIGHLILTTLAPAITAVITTRSYPGPSTSVPPTWAQISHWATRPRATGPLVFIMILVLFWFDPKPFQGEYESDEAFRVRQEAHVDRPNGKKNIEPYKTAVITACFGDQVVSALGLDNVNRMLAYRKSQGLNIKGFQMLRVGIVFGFVTDAAIIWLLCRDIYARLRDYWLGAAREVYYSGWESGLALFATFALIPHQFICFIGGWLVWKEFLEDTSEREFCVQDTWQIDLVYYLLPVVLNVWRIMAKRGRVRKVGNGG